MISFIISLDPISFNHVIVALNYGPDVTSVSELDAQLLSYKVLLEKSKKDAVTESLFVNLTQGGNVPSSIS